MYNICLWYIMFIFFYFFKTYLSFKFKHVVTHITITHVHTCTVLYTVGFTKTIAISLSKSSNLGNFAKTATWEAPPGHVSSQVCRGSRHWELQLQPETRLWCTLTDNSMEPVGLVAKGCERLHKFMKDSLEWVYILQDVQAKTRQHSYLLRLVFQG